MEQVGAGEKIFLLKKVFICNTSVNYMSVIEMKIIPESCVRENPTSSWMLHGLL